MRRWDIYWTDVPYEEDPNIIKRRPVIIAKDKSPTYVLTFKITSKPARECDLGDYPLIYWKESGLREPRASFKTLKLTKVKYKRGKQPHESRRLSSHTA